MTKDQEKAINCALDMYNAYKKFIDNICEVNEQIKKIMIEELKEEGYDLP